jgi:hypothetical protein
MIRFAWRQFRLQAVIAFAILAVIAVLVVATHSELVHLYKLHETGALLNRYGSLENIVRLLLVAPALIGMFWGAPLIARELESGTHRLIWTQSVTRRRWLAVKLGLVGGASVAVCGLLSLAVTWWSGPVDRINLDRLSSTLIFSERGLVPLGYGAFAFAVGVVLGLLLRRTVPAMAATLAVFTGARFALVSLRPHLLPPIHGTVPLTAANIQGVGITSRNGPLIATVSVHRPGAWVLSSSSQPALDSAGKVVYGLGKELANATPQSTITTLVRLHLHVLVVYQPASRFWTFQAIETAVFGGVALILVGFCFWWVHRRSI